MIGFIIGLFTGFFFALARVSSQRELTQEEREPEPLSIVVQVETQREAWQDAPGAPEPIEPPPIPARCPQDCSGHLVARSRDGYRWCRLHDRLVEPHEGREGTA